MPSIEIKKQFVLLAIAFLILIVSACEDKIEYTKESDMQKLEALRAEIKAMSEQEKCENASDWKFRAIGSQACGGPTGFVSYSVKIDTNAFIQKVNKYTADQAAFNKKWKIVSVCMLILPPKNIICENEKPKLAY